MLLPDSLPNGRQQGATHSAGGTCPPAPFHVVRLTRRAGAHPTPQHSRHGGAFNRLSHGTSQRQDPSNELSQAQAGTKTGLGNQAGCRPSPGRTRTWGPSSSRCCTRPTHKLRGPSCHTRASPGRGEKGHPVCSPARAVGRGWNCCPSQPGSGPEDGSYMPVG